MSARRVLGATGGLALGLGVAGAVAVLLGRVATTAAEIERYADDILTGAEGIVHNLAGTGALQRTGELAAGVLALVSGEEAR